MTAKNNNPTPKHHARVMQKPKNFKKALTALIQYINKYIPAIAVASIMAILGAVFTLIGPDKLSQITDLVKDGLMLGIDLKAITKLAITLVIIYVFSSLFSLIQGLVMATVTQRITKKLRTDIIQKINRLPLSYFDKISFGDVLSRVTNDIDTIGQTLNQSIGTLMSALALFLGSLIAMYITNAIMATTAVFTTIIGFGTMAIIVSKSQKYFKIQQQQLGDINGHIEEAYAGHNIVKAYNASHSSKATFSAINERMYSSAWKSQFLSGLMMPLMGFIGNLGFVGVCVVGGALVFSGKMSFGVIVAFMVYVRLFSQPLSQIAQAATSLQSTAAASERVFDFLAEQELSDETNNTAIVEAPKGNVEFVNVRFGYNPNKIIINDFTASVKAGQKVAIVGPTGAGKTTMVNLLMKFYDIHSGEIYIDDVPISQMSRARVHDLFCMVLQDTWLFEGTIRENIKYSKQDISDEEMIKACKAAGIHHFIKTLQHGYDTVLNDQINLSAGQKQLLTIARAMIEDAPMLILDEATSSVDTRTEIQIQKAMDKLTIGRTSFIIAHRLSTIKNAHLILVMRDGDIIESGTHDELIGQDSFYAELYNSQFDTVSDD